MSDNNKQDRSSEFDERLARNEQGIENLHNSVSELAKTTRQLGRDMVDGFTELRRDRETAGKTPWGVIGTFVGIAMATIISIGSIVSSSTQADIRRLEAGQVSLRSWSSTHDKEVSGLNNSQNFRLDAAEAGRLEMDMILQRELKALEMSIQQASEMRHSAQQDQISELRKSMTRLLDTMHKAHP